jgi:hypothetical protein
VSVNEKEASIPKLRLPYHCTTFYTPGLEHVTTQEDKGVQRDILHRGGDITLGRQVRQERPHVRRPSPCQVLLIMEVAEAADGLDVALLGGDGLLPGAPGGIMGRRPHVATGCGTIQS